MEPVEILDSLRVQKTGTDIWRQGLWTIFIAPDDIKKAKIDVTTAGTHKIINTTAGKRLIILSIFFTVADEVDITLYEGSTPITGPMDFGGATEAHGIAINFGGWPMVLDTSKDLKINLSAAVQVSGAVTYIEA
jgi:hypothetical protein